MGALGAHSASKRVPDVHAAASGGLTGTLEHDDLALRDMAVIVVQRQVVLFAHYLPMIPSSGPSFRLDVAAGGCIICNGTTRAIAQYSGEAALNRSPLVRGC